MNNIHTNRIRRILIGLLILCILIITASGISYQIRETHRKMPAVAEIHITSDAMKAQRLMWEDGYVDASIRIDSQEHVYIEDTGRIKARGNSTLEADKLSYAYKFDDKLDVLGMGKEKKWVLLANAYDPTLMRNYIAMETAKKLRLNYTSECRYVDLWINDIFMGNYLITEPVQDGGERVDIHPAAGDFLIEYERTREDEDETSYVVTDGGYRYLIHDPKNANESQAEYVLGVMNHVEEVISEVQAKSVSTNDGNITADIDMVIDETKDGDVKALEKTTNGIRMLSGVIDIASFVDYCVFAEFMKSVDMGFSSEYYYYKDGILYAGPVWDYDMSAGNVNSSYYTHYSNLATTGDSTQGFWINEQGKLLKELMDCSEFEQLVWDRYKDDEVQDIITGIYDDGGLIDELLKTYGASFERNYSEAGWEEGKQYFAYAGTPLPTFEENVNYLRDWFQRRNEWLLSKH